MRDPTNRLRVLFGEIRRRGIFKIVAAYAVVAWGASQGAASLLPAFGVPAWAIRAFVVCAILGLPITAALAWIFEITGGRIVRDRGSSLDFAGRGNGEQAGNTTLLFGATDSVRARWRDVQGSHEKVFFKAFRIGRDESCELRIDDPLISRRHAEVRFDHDRWWVVDLQSRNGTRLDGQLVERAPLSPICSVQLYDAAPALTLEVGGPSAAVTIASRPGILPTE